MNKILTSLAATAVTLSATAASPAITSWPEGTVTNVSVERAVSNLLVNMDINTDLLPVKSNREIWLRPALVAPGDTLLLEPVVVAGHTRYYQHRRARDIAEGTVLLRGHDAHTYAYSTVVPYADWMQLSQVILIGDVDGCCGANLGPVDPDLLASLDYREKNLDPVLIYVSPTKEIIKTRAVSGEAYIDFPVNKTQIFPDYRRNPAELAEIRRTIDAVRDDADVTITSLSFRGYASPEGPYDLNERLAKGRTEALIDYVRKLYSFPRDIMHSSWQAEDWDGLEARVRKLDIADRDAILALIADNSLTPDQRDQQLKKRFPEQYTYLLNNVYPALRHSDYNIEYQIRNFTDVREIAAVMATAPQKLSLDELFLYAQSLDKSSPEFREVMEVAVRMYPDDPEANLNAAATAVDHGEYDLARSYLAKAGDTPQAAYTAGVMEAKQGNYAAAKPLFQRASAAGVTEADTLLSRMLEWGWID